MEEFRIYCGGEFMAGGTKLPVTGKFSGEVIAHTWQASAGMLDQAVRAAETARPLCAEWPAYERSEALRLISGELGKHRRRHAELLAAESGKPMRYALAEVDRASHTLLIASEECRRLPREYSGLDWVKHGRSKEALVKYFPVGLVAGISPFNFPLNLAVHKLAPAIAAGCPIILKPASQTPLSTLALAGIIHEAGLPKGAVSVLPMDRKTGNLLVTDDRVHMLSFTGSPDVGWKLKEQSGKKKVVLELGGNAGVIVCRGTDPHKIIDKCLAGGFAYSGQICIHAQRFYVHDSVYNTFLSAFVAGAKQMTCGDPLREETLISNMIDEENASRVEHWIREACEAGATLHSGGKRTGSYVEPTVLSKTNSSMKVNAEEVFGPVVCIEKFSGDIQDAVRQVNESRFGLQCGVFTDSVAELDYAFNQLHVGGVIHNDVPTLRFDQMPYGGVKDSGLGREGVKYAIMDMMEARVLVK